MLPFILIILAFLPLRIVLQDQAASGDPFTLAKWEMFKRTTTEGNPAFVRANVALRDLKRREKYPYRVGFAVKFRNPNEFGLPTDDEGRELTTVENEIEHAMSQKKLGFLSLVITTGGAREYVYYSNRPDEVRARITRMKGNVKGREIRTYVTADPGWEVYDRFTQ